MLDWIIIMISLALELSMTNDNDYYLNIIQLLAILTATVILIMTMT